MATYFRTKVQASIGTTPVTPLSTGATNIFTIIGLNLANITDYDAIVNITITDSTPTTGYYISGLIIPPYTSVKVVTNSEKIVLGNNSSITLVSDTAASIDATFSYAEVA